MAVVKYTSNINCLPWNRRENGEAVGNNCLGKGVLNNEKRSREKSDWEKWGFQKESCWQKETSRVRHNKPTIEFVIS
ncbi:hypothetical protein RUM44_001820 [Polyplax serrata]|uniref:Uncharacterized protein n=1 Tax=Polyplax serrata TaxID=468196 RepID=A0ABR1AL52_POLSC